ncbi:uncharacterized protein LOC129555198 [Moschus berezovskii]|uniref:uncharacterized protein LOC129555198 n=1 Tax=Moschus berezovskii TaxID=68408 RepID=UPI0024448C1E|nr:uncharacterized protein LOC129555198 [Moschus berezovskii]
MEEDGFQVEREKHVQSPWGAEAAIVSNRKYTHDDTIKPQTATISGSSLSRGPWPQIEHQSLCNVVNAQTHISSSANQSQKDEKGDGQGTAKVSKGITETWLQSQVSMVSSSVKSGQPSSLQLLVHIQGLRKNRAVTLGSLARPFVMKLLNCSNLREPEGKALDHLKRKQRWPPCPACRVLSSVCRTLWGEALGPCFRQVSSPHPLSH